MRRCLFYSDTPLQVFLAALIVQQESDKAYEAEIIVCNQFSGAAEVAEKLRNLRIFKKVHFISLKNDRRYKTKIHFNTLLGRGLGLVSEIKDVKYDCYAIAYSTFVNQNIYVDLSSVNKNIEVVFYEDGLGSYTGNVFNNASYIGIAPKGIVAKTAFARAQNAILKRIRGCLGRYRISAMYLREPGLVQYFPECECVEIEFSENAVSRASECFNKGNLSRIGSCGIIVLDGLRNKDTDVAEIAIIDRLLRGCLEKGIGVYIRKHPASTFNSEYDKDFVDCSGGFWEVECLHLDLEKCMLIGMASTAQLTPAMTYKKLPALLFVNWIEADASEAAARIYKMARKLYGKKADDRIYLPTTIDEAVELIYDWNNNHISRS